MYIDGAKFVAMTIDFVVAASIVILYTALVMFNAVDAVCTRDMLVWPGDLTVMYASIYIWETLTFLFPITHKREIRAW